MCRKVVSWACVVMILGPIATSAALAQTVIMAEQSARTQQSSPETNISDSSKLTIRTTAGDPTRTYKSWVKFDVSGLDVGSLETATLTVALFQDRSATCTFDVSYVNDDCLDNIGWDRRSLTWNNGPGNSINEIGALDPAKTTWLTTVEFADGVAGDTFTIDVLDALESDTDGIVQFVFHNSSAYMILCSHEYADEAWRPFLTVTEGPKGKARKPVPADGEEDVYQSPVLGWKPGTSAVMHDVYMGTAFDDVNDASAGSPLLVSPAQDANTYEPGRLELGRTYFWRIDEISAPPESAVFKGDVWSFTVEPVARAIAIDDITATASSSLNADSGPQKTVDGSGLNDLDQHDTTNGTMWLSTNGQQPPVWIQYEFDRVYKLHEMWVWNSNNSVESLIGLGVKTATVEYSADGVAWAALANVPEFAQATGSADYVHDTTVDFNDVAAKFVRITITSNWGGMAQYGLSEVRFFYIPVLASEPHPAAGATGVTPDAILSWRPGREAASHEVYLGVDPNALTLAGTVSASSYAPADLLLGTQYYWRIDEVNTAEPISTWVGDVWNFTVGDSVSVDDFESYTNNSPHRVFQTWVDGAGFSPDEFFPNGYGGNGTGSYAGYDPTLGDIMEKSVVHGGRQSMPFFYDNSSATATSETTRTFAEPQDWTRAGIKTLTLYFYGDPGNAAAQLYVKINSTKIAYSGDAGDIQQSRWTVWNIDLSTVSASTLRGVKTLTIGVGSGAGSGTLFIDDIGLYHDAPAVPVAVDPIL